MPASSPSGGKTSLLLTTLSFCLPSSDVKHGVTFMRSRSRQCGCDLFVFLVSCHSDAITQARAHVVRQWCARFSDMKAAVTLRVCSCSDSNSDRLESLRDVSAARLRKPQTKVPTPRQAVLPNPSPPSHPDFAPGSLKFQLCIYCAWRSLFYFLSRCGTFCTLILPRVQ
jgi:hypothetical protein